MTFLLFLTLFQLHEQSWRNSFAKKYKFLCVRVSAPNEGAGNDGLTTRRNPNGVDGPGVGGGGQSVSIIIENFVF